MLQPFERVSRQLLQASRVITHALGIQLAEGPGHLVNGPKFIGRAAGLLQLVAEELGVVSKLPEAVAELAQVAVPEACPGIDAASTSQACTRSADISETGAAASKLSVWPTVTTAATTLSLRVLPLAALPALALALLARLLTLATLTLLTLLALAALTLLTLAGLLALTVLALALLALASLLPLTVLALFALLALLTLAGLLALALLTASLQLLVECLHAAQEVASLL